MKLYGELAGWWPVFSDPKEYRLEAAHVAKVLRKSTKPSPRTVLELGSGGGNSAFHLKSHFEMTLVDMSPQMLKVSRKLNPECRHIRGDIRTLRLGRTFDAVYVHDAICHMTTERELRAVMQTAYEHCRPGGVALFVPDFVRETFVAGTDKGGTDSAGRRLRFLQWLGGDCDSCSGSLTRTPATRLIKSTLRSCCATKQATRAWLTTVTSSACSRGRDGCACCVTRGSSLS